MVQPLFWDILHLSTGFLYGIAVILIWVCDYYGGQKREGLFR